MRIFLFSIFLFFATLHANAQNDIKVDDAQTIAVFNFLFGNNQASNLTINEDDRKHAVDFVKELITKSCEITVVEGLSSYNGSLISLVKNIASATKGCETAKNGKYLETVRKAVAYNWSTSFTIRKQTGEW